MNNAALVASLLTSLLVGCVTEDGTLATDDPSSSAPSTSSSNPKGPTPTFTPSSCQEIVDRDPSATDGDYTLYVQRQASLPWPAYCADMQTAPIEYLVLAQTGNGKNTSMYKAGAASVVTEYHRLRINPDSLMIDISDQTFTMSTGSLSHMGLTVTSMPFAIAMTCGGNATANIDFTGTPFRPEDAFPVEGTNMTLKYNLSSDRKSLDLAVDGTSCGFAGPDLAPAEPINDAGNFALRLAYAG